LPRCVHEVNTLVWLSEVSARAGRQVTLADVPAEEWDAVVLPGVDCVWLMGVWERSPAGRAIALADEGNRSSWDAALPGWTEDDVLGSPYCVKAYVCAERFGGRHGLSRARAELADRGARLLVDLVPNHVAPDHPLVHDEPEAFVRGDAEDLARDPDGFIEIGSGADAVVVACARDPYFPPWRDVVQLNAFAPAARAFLRRTLLDIAEQADGVRCDMAMLLLDDVFGATWGERAGAPLPEPLWVEVLEDVRVAHPGFVVVAEAYWGREPDLLAQGFDACYDKVLYDRLVGASASEVLAHVRGLASDNASTVRFLENHDEPRAAATVPPPERELAASVALATLPGLTLWHEGQLDGRTVRVPVFLARRPDESPDPGLRAGLARVLEVAQDVRAPAVGPAEWHALDTAGWPDNPSHEHLLAWAWCGSVGAAPWSLVVVNYSAADAQGLVRLPAHATHGAGAWRFRDLLSGETYDRDRDDLEQNSFFVDLPGWGHHVLVATPLT
jgi:hypothetical protein